MMKIKGNLSAWCITIVATMASWSCNLDKVYDFNPKEHSSIVIVGNTFAEQLQTYNYFEVLMHQSFPDRQLKVRNLGWSADEVNLQPRPLSFGGLDQYLQQEKADYIIACYGLNEAFKGKDSLDVFGQHLSDFLRNLQQQQYNGNASPQIILVSPIAHEEMGGLMPDPGEHNKNLKLYTGRMQRVAEELGISFINLYDPTKKLMEESTTKLTYNGIHLNDEGYKQVSEIMAKTLSFPISSYRPEPVIEDLRKVIQLKNQHFFYKYRAVNGEYIYGRRNKPYGVESFPPEFAKLDRIVGTMDSVIWTGSTAQSSVDLATIHRITNDTLQYEPYDPKMAKRKPSTDQFVIKKGYKIELFASEQDFPIGNATAFNFDAKGRLWVSTLESFPQMMPGTLPNDKLVILEDKDKDGKADDYTIFADSLYEPLGFELGDGGVYLSQPPNLVFLKDTDNDGRADVKTPLLHGFGTEDVHHTISAFTWGQDGALYMHEGTFLHSQIETPYGPVRSAYGTTWRYEPYTQKMEQYVSFPYANPWGNVFMRNGIHLIGDASGGNNYYAAPMTVAIEYPRKHMVMDDFPTTRLRPTCGLEIISSRHFPESVQGHMLQPNIVGFQGIKQYEIIKSGSGVTANEVEPLLQSKDLNFRPVAISFGPDGALYILDFYNPIVGHMTYSFRDPNRDHVHGRIWRVTYEGKDTLAPRDLTQLNIAQLLDQLKEYEDRTRYRARAQLREFPKQDVLTALGKWLGELDTGDKNYDQNRLEGLWLYQQLHHADDALLAQLLQSSNDDVRAAATRVLYYWKDLVPDVQERLITMSKDAAQRVRLESIVALSHFNTKASVNALLATIDLPVDYYIYYALNESFKQLRPIWMDMFKSDKDFLKGEPEKAFYLLASVTSATSLELSYFVKEDPEHEKYTVKPFDEADYSTLADAPAIVEFWIGKKNVPEDVKVKGLDFLAKLEGKGPKQIVNDRLAFMETMEKKVNALLNWKDQSKIKEGERAKHDVELKADIQALSQLLESHQETEAGPTVDASESDKVTIHIKSLAGQMTYDKKAFTVKAGQTVEIVFLNEDEMQHNLLIIQPGTLNKVGEMAEEMAKEPDAFKKNFIPATKDVLFTTPLLDPNVTYSLTFIAPKTPGDYPFVCTFPGHWRIMNGIMKVIKN